MKFKTMSLLPVIWYSKGIFHSSQPLEISREDVGNTWSGSEQEGRRRPIPQSVEHVLFKDKVRNEFFSGLKASMVAYGSFDRNFVESLWGSTILSRGGGQGWQGPTFDMFAGVLHPDHISWELLFSIDDGLKTCDMFYGRVTSSKKLVDLRRLECISGKLQWRKGWGLQSSCRKGTLQGVRKWPDTF